MLQIDGKKDVEDVIFSKKPENSGCKKNFLEYSDIVFSGEMPEWPKGTVC